jgi:hypothetical protein
MERIPESDRTREKLKAVIEGSDEGGTSELVRLAARLIIEEALEGEARDAVGRDYYARGAAPGAGYRNGYRSGRLRSAEGTIEYSAPQIADRAERFRSAIREIVRGRTAELEARRWNSSLCPHQGALCRRRSSHMTSPPLTLARAGRATGQSATRFP